MGGEAEIPGLTDGDNPCRLGPKRASKIRKLFGLDKKDDVRKYVVKRQIGDTKKWKSPKIQRLVTPKKLQRRKKQRKEIYKRMEVGKKLKQEWQKRCGEWAQEKKEARA